MLSDAFHTNHESTKLNSNTQGVMVIVAIEFGEQVMARYGEQLTYGCV